MFIADSADLVDFTLKKFVKTKDTYCETTSILFSEAERSIDTRLSKLYTA